MKKYKVKYRGIIGEVGSGMSWSGCFEEYLKFIQSSGTTARR